MKCLDRRTSRKADRWTHTSSGLTEEIGQIKRHGPVSFSQETDLAKEYSRHAEQEHYNGLGGVYKGGTVSKREAEIEREGERKVARKAVI